jgi:glycosyltransferase involved in cell wall biosynthesis
MNDILVSVIMPVYNGEDLLKRCIDSILIQTHKNLEVILVNDGSTDGSKDILQNYEKVDARVKTVCIENSGQAKARNVGLDRCHGAYISFVDADDFITPDHIEKMLDLAKKYDADLIQCGYEVGYNSAFRQAESEIFEITNFENNAIFESPLYTSVPWGKLYKSHLYKTVRFPSTKQIDDEGMTYMPYYMANKTIYTPEKLYYAYLSKNSSTRNIKRYPLSFMETFEQRLTFFKQHNEEKLYEISLIRYCLSLSIKHMRMECNPLNTKEDLDITMSRFNELYPMAIDSKYIRRKHVVIIKSFKRFPKMMARVEDTVTRIRRLCGSY